MVRRLIDWSLNNVLIVVVLTVALAGAPRDEVSTRSPTESRGNPSTPAPSTWIHLMAGVSFRTSASWSVGNATSTSLEP